MQGLTLSQDRVFAAREQGFFALQTPASLHFCFRV